MRKLLFLFTALLPASSWATYNYFETDNLQSQNNSAPNWYIDGSASNSSSGLTVTTAAGGSYILRTLAPDGTDQYEVAATLNLPASGGNYGKRQRNTPGQSGLLLMQSKSERGIQDTSRATTEPGGGLATSSHL